MTGIVAHTYPEWWLKLAGQVAHWSTDYSLKTKEWLANHGISKDTYYYWYKKVQTICVEAMEMPDTLSMPEFVSLPVPAEPANVPVESAIKSDAIVTMHIGKARIDIPETTSTEFIKKLIGVLAHVE